MKVSFLKVVKLTEEVLHDAHGHVEARPLFNRGEPTRVFRPKETRGSWDFWLDAGVTLGSGKRDDAGKQAHWV